MLLFVNALMYHVIKREGNSKKGVFMKRIEIVLLFPSICLGVAFLCVNSVKLGSRGNGYIHSLNQAVEATGADVEEQVDTPEAAPMPEAQPNVNQEPPAMPEAPAEIKAEMPTVPAEVLAPAVEAAPAPAPQVQEKAVNLKADDVINNLIDQVGALMAQKVADQVHVMMQERVQMRLKTFIKDELKRIMESCPVDMIDEIVEENKASAPEAMDQAAQQESNEQMSDMNQNDFDMIGNM
jgi:hypothetical protein